MSVFWGKKEKKKKLSSCAEFAQKVVKVKTGLTVWPRHHFIMKICLYNFDPLQPHFHIVKLGFTGVHIIFLISAQKHRLWVLIRTGYSLEQPHRGGSNKYQKSMFWAEIWKAAVFFYLKIFSFWRRNLLYIWIVCFHNVFSWQNANFLCLWYSSFKSSFFLQITLSYLSKWVYK